MRYRQNTAGQILLATLLVCSGLGAQAADKVLILDSTVLGGLYSAEAQAATALGYQVDIVNATAWAAMSATDFSGYRAIILGDPQCGPVSAIAAAEANKGVWAPVVNGNIIIIGTDCGYPHPNGATLTTNGIRFATYQANKTGLYMTLSCYYRWVPSGTPVPILSPFGSFTVEGPDSELVHIVATHPALTDLSDVKLSYWYESVHEAFDTWPASFIPLAIAENVGNVYSAGDLSVGTPYILARGPGLTKVRSRIKLTPAKAENPLYAPHTLCATAITNGAMAKQVDLNFTVTSGPNTGTSGQVTTDDNGEACFTYYGYGGVGTDTIIAEYTDALNHTLTSYEVTKTWFDPCGSTALTATATGAICGSNSVLIQFNELISDFPASDPGSYFVDQGLNVINATVFGGGGVLLQMDQTFVSGTIYTLQIFDVMDLCGRTVQPNPFTVQFSCTPVCPGLVCPDDITTQCSGTGGTQVYFTPHVNPDCPGVSVICTPPSGSYFSAGTTPVFCTTSTLNNSNTCVFHVTVTDLVPPIIQCPENIVVTSCADVSVPYNPIATDNCCPNPSVICSPPSGSYFAPGTTTSVHCVARDCNTNFASCDFTVTVNRPPPPSLVCSTNIVTVRDPGQCSALVNYSIEVVTNCPDQLVTRLAGLPSGSTFPKGITTNIFELTSNGVSVASCSFTVTVLDRDTPTITCPTNIVASTDPGQCSAVVNYTINATITCPGETVAQLTGLPSGSAFPKGVTTNRFEFRDHGVSVATCSFTVTVLDKEKPTISCPPDKVVVANPNTCKAAGVLLGTPNVSDNCPGVVVKSNAPAGNIFPIGQTSVVWTAKDASGNQNVCTQKVTVLGPMRVSFLAPLDCQPVAGKVRRGQVVPHKIDLAGCTGCTPTKGVTVKLKVQGIDSANNSVFQDVIEDAKGTGKDGTPTSDGIMVLNGNHYQFDLDTSNFTDPNTQSGTRYYKSTVIVTDNATQQVLGTGSVNLETKP